MPISAEKMRGPNRFINALARENREAPLPPKRCDMCGEKFSPYNRKARFCSRDCVNAARRTEGVRQKKCRRCGEAFTAPSSSAQRAYCSVECRSLTSRNRPAVAANRKARQKEYAKTAQYRFAQNNYKARRRSAERSGDAISYEQWGAILKKYGSACAYCNSSNLKLTIDHVVPLSKGGRHEIANIVPACVRCNSSKCDKDWSHRLAN